MAYIEGLVLAVPTKNRSAYRKYAQETVPLFKEYGAIRLVECWGDDVPAGKVTSFPAAVKCRPDETVVFSWILWPSKAARNKGLKRMMADPRMASSGKPMPFDAARMIHGGFRVIVDA